MSKLDISAVVPQWKSGGQLNQRVALLTSQKNPEDELFKISFKFYNDNECEITSETFEETIKRVININFDKSYQTKTIDICSHNIHLRIVKVE